MCQAFVQYSLLFFDVANNQECWEKCSTTCHEHSLSKYGMCNLMSKKIRWNCADLGQTVPIRSKLCRFGPNSADLSQIMPIWAKLCWFGPNFAVSGQIMPIRAKICRFGPNYADSGQIVPIRAKLCPFGPNYADLSQFYRFFTLGMNEYHWINLISQSES